MSHSARLYSEVLLLLVCAGLAAAGQYALQGRQIEEKLPWNQLRKPGLVSVHSVRDWLESEDSLQVLDARSEEDFLAGHLPGALWLPWEAFLYEEPEALEALDPRVTTVVYCSGFECESSRLVGGELLHRGFLRVYVMEAGFPVWLREGLAVEVGEAGDG